MNNKILQKLSLFLIISICAGNSICTSTENQNKSNNVFENVTFEKEEAKFDELKNKPISNKLDVLCDQEFNESSSPETIMSYIIDSVVFIKNNNKFKDELEDLLGDVIEKSNKVHHPEKPMEKKLQKQLIKESDNLIQNKIGAKLNQYVILKSKLQNLRRMVNSMNEKSEKKNIDSKLMEQMNTAVDSIIKKKTK